MIFRFRKDQWNMLSPVLENKIGYSDDFEAFVLSMISIGEANLGGPERSKHVNDDISDEFNTASDLQTP